ncbi:hypothetical protein PAAG_07179 [Paracoccidioides lutzii Pb01]|uniref:Uncharacterized protein n=1 Tax=Paracoccidioides lutzii (strain ATCC MYA-826 / Pb01) TaxID=502779 RepID=C1H8T8_PARBA|nr:hypothetical protein PAAG_07179 [Paracoccidioides lutzii Pb01]EEH36761.2 hypothetical protein PAAG_07179 [Paracoccidioides lutzii Pb01]
MSPEEPGEAGDDDTEMKIFGASLFFMTREPIPFQSSLESKPGSAALDERSRSITVTAPSNYLRAAYH